MNMQKIAQENTQSLKDRKIINRINQIKIFRRNNIKIFN